jgi:microcystin-dependent protein
MPAPWLVCGFEYINNRMPFIMKKSLTLTALICGLCAIVPIIIGSGLISAQNVGVGNATPVEKLDINGAIRIGTTSNTNAGTIRWDGTNFQGYNGTTWIDLSYQADAPGTIVAYGGTSAPTGWLLCDGTSYTTTAQATLFAAIAYNFGGSGANFNVPDLRGRFLRGLDGTAGNDPDKLTRTVSATGGLAGNNVGSLQADALKSHNHRNASLGAAGQIPTGPYLAIQNSQGLTTNGLIEATGGNETRPKNVYVNYIIKK